MSLVIKAKIQKKNNNSRIIETFTEILKDRGNKQLFVDFKDKYNAWSREFSDEWSSYETAKSNAYEAFKPSRLIRTVATAIIFFSVLEYFRTANILFLALAFTTIIAYLAINVTSVIIVSYFAAQWKYLIQALEYFKAVNTMATRFSRRLNIIQRTFYLNFNCHDLHLNDGCITHNSLWNLILPAVSAFNIYGAVSAVIVFAMCFYAQHDIFLVLGPLIICFVIFVALRNDVKIFSSLRCIKRIQSHMVTITQDFKTWFQNDCELNHILQELKIDNDKLFLFPSKNFVFFKEEPYLNFALFLVMFESTLRRYLNTNKADELFLFLLNGSKKFSTDVIKKDLNISVNENFTPDNLNEKENQPIHNQNITDEICRAGMEKKKNKSENKACGLTSEDNSYINAVDDDHANMAKENGCKKHVKSRIPKLMADEMCNYTHNDKLPETLKFDENLQFRPELSPKNLAQDSCEDSSISSSENICVCTNLKSPEVDLHICCNEENIQNSTNDAELTNCKSNEINFTIPFEDSHNSESFEYESSNFSSHFDNSCIEDETDMNTVGGKDILTIQGNETSTENSSIGVMPSSLNSGLVENSELANKTGDIIVPSEFLLACLEDVELYEMFQKIRSNVSSCNSFDTVPESVLSATDSNKLNSYQKMELLRKIYGNAKMADVEKGSDTADNESDSSSGVHEAVRSISSVCQVLDKIHDDAEIAGIEKGPDTVDCKNDSSSEDRESGKNISGIYQQLSKINNDVEMDDIENIPADCKSGSYSGDNEFERNISDDSQVLDKMHENTEMTGTEKGRNAADCTSGDYQGSKMSERMDSANNCYASDINESAIGHHNLYAAGVIGHSERIFSHALDKNSQHFDPKSAVFEPSSNELHSSGQMNGASQHLLSNEQQIKKVTDEEKMSDFANTTERGASNSVSTTTIIEKSKSPLTNECGENVLDDCQNINETTNAETVSVCSNNDENNLSNYYSKSDQMQYSNCSDTNPTNLFSPSPTTFCDPNSNYALSQQSSDHLGGNLNFYHGFRTGTFTEPGEKDFVSRDTLNGQNNIYENCDLTKGETQFFQRKETGNVFQFKSDKQTPNLELKANLKGVGEFNFARGIQGYFDGQNNVYGNSLVTEGRTRDLQGNEIPTVTGTEKVYQFGSSKEIPKHALKTNFNFTFGIPFSQNSMPLNNSTNFDQTPVPKNMDFESIEENENTQKTKETLEDNLKQVKSKIIPLTSESIEPGKNPTSLQPRRILKTKRKNVTSGDAKSIIEKNVERPLNAGKLENGDILNPPEFMALDEAKTNAKEKVPLRNEPGDSLSMSSDLNCDMSESQTDLDTSLDSPYKASQKCLLETPSLLTNKSIFYSYAKGTTTNEPDSEHGITVSAYANSNSDNNAFQTNTGLKSTQNAFILREDNAKQLFSIGECRSPGTQSNSSEVETSNKENNIEEEYHESQPSDLSTIARTSHLLQTHKTKDFKLFLAEKGRKVIKGQVNFARKEVKKKNREYICESSSVEMLYSQNEDICEKDEGDTDQMLRTMDGNINCLETYNSTSPASSAEYLNNDSYEIPEEENDFIRNRQSLSSAHSRLSEEISNGSSEFKDKDYRMIGSSEDENFHFHYSTTDTSSLSQGSINTTHKPLQEFTETDESNEESVVTVKPYDPEKEEVTHSVSASDDEQKVGWHVKHLQNSTCNKVQSEEGRNSIDYTDSKQECNSNGNKQDNVTTWRSSLEMDEHLDGDSEQNFNEEGSRRSEEERNYSFADEQQDAKPLRYNLKYENLDLSILDSSPCITIKLVCEKEVENPKPERNQLKQVRSPEHRLSSKYEILLTPEDSTFRSSTEVPYAEISKLNLTVTAGREDGSETLNSTPQPVLNEQTLPRKDLQDSGFDEVDETYNKLETASGIRESGLKDDLNSSIKKTENISGHPTGESTNDHKIASEEKRELDTGIAENNVCDSDSNNQQQCVENVLESTTDAITECDKNDFNFETDNLQLNYKPTPHSGSIDVSFRKTRNCKKLVFKTEEKKLYVKMTPPH